MQFLEIVFTLMCLLVSTSAHLNLVIKNQWFNDVGRIGPFDDLVLQRNVTFPSIGIWPSNENGITNGNFTFDLVGKGEYGPKDTKGPYELVEVETGKKLAYVHETATLFLVDARTKQKPGFVVQWYTITQYIFGETLAIQGATDSRHNALSGLVFSPQLDVDCPHDNAVGQCNEWSFRVLSNSDRAAYKESYVVYLQVIPA